MAPSEASILEQFLLAPAQLPTVLSLDDFAALFPKPLQSSPHVRALYRDLQRQRNAVLDAVVADIDDEVARGPLLRRYALRARLRADAQEDAAGDDELQIERFVAAAPSDAQGRRNGSTAGPAGSHSLASVVAELDDAVQQLDSELEQLEEEEARLLQSVQQSVGSLSDLRYGRLANPQLRDEILESLQNVQATCERITEVPSTGASTGATGATGRRLAT